MPHEPNQSSPLPTDLERLLGAPADLRIECTCGAVLELRGRQAIASDLAIDWTNAHTGDGHKQRRVG